MGCNTSKESVQPAAEEAKEDVKNGDIPKSAENSVAETESKEKSKDKEAEEKKEEKTDDKDKDEAATTIQAAFRGHHVRKSMKETEGTTKNQEDTKTDSNPTKEQLHAEFRTDDKELSDAATKIQASFRGHMSRKEQAASTLVKSAEEFVQNAATKIEEKMIDTVNDVAGIDLTDPDLHKAATKIQASFRGHKVRQEGTPAPITETQK